MKATPRAGGELVEHGLFRDKCAVRARIGVRKRGDVDSSC